MLVVTCDLVGQSPLPGNRLNDLNRLHLVWAVVVVIFVDILLDRTANCWKLWWRIARGARVYQCISFVFSGCAT